MQKVILIIMLFSELVITGCKKNNIQNTPPPTPPAFQSYIKFKLDNVQTECTSQIKAPYFPSFPDTSISITGVWTNGSIQVHISGDQQPITAGIYTFNSTKWHSGTIWTNNPGGRYVAGMDLYRTIYSGSGYITITEISTHYIKGSFEFITAIDSTTNIFKTVTSGEFHVKRD